MTYAYDAGAFLEITLDISPENRRDIHAICLKYKEYFKKEVQGAVFKQLLFRSDDIQLLHGFKNEGDANTYLKSNLFAEGLTGELHPYLEGNPDIRIYSVKQ